MAHPLSPSQFRRRLLAWLDDHDRELPWKGEPDPYLIWLSEIILQQTRVDQGLPYFLRFKETFPTVFELAAATEDQVFKLWEGLGYYARARNLHATAKRIVSDFGGRFPDNYADILSLKGVGPYTAAAIASFGFQLPHAVVDGNVYRVLARIWGIDTPIDSSPGKRQFQELADELLDPSKPGRYNQAIMDFGAIWCTPANPQCRDCPFEQECQAKQTNRITDLPVKKKKIQKKDRYFHYLDFDYEALTWLSQRSARDIWQGLYEFPMVEGPRLWTEWEQVLKQVAMLDWLGHSSYEVIQKSPPFRQTLSHQHIHAIFWKIQLSQPSPVLNKEFVQIERKNLPKFAVPKIVDWYLRDNTLYLNV